MGAGAGRYVAVGIVAALATAGIGAPSIRRDVVHRPDSEAFQTYLQTYIGNWRDSRDPNRWKVDKRWAADHPDAVLAEGKAACAWLARRPDPPSVDPSGSSMSSLVGIRYQKKNPVSKVPGVSRMGRDTTVAGAWTYCAGGPCTTRQLGRVSRRTTDEG